MADNNGWIKLHRKIIDSAVFENPKILKLWIWCLCKASHKGYESMVGNQIVALQEGQFIFGRKKASSELKIKESMVYKYIKLLEKLEMINIKSNNKFSIITIEKWAFYQFDNDEEQQQKEQQRNNKGTTKEQQRNTNKNVKNVKNVKEIIYSDVPELNETIIAFIDYRKSIKKPMSDRAITLLLGKLNKMSNSVQEQIEILNQSILNGWQGIFPLKNDSGSVNKSGFQGRNYDFDELERQIVNK